MSTLIWRDAFARSELHRVSVAVTGKETCDWCGSLNAAGKLFVYRLEYDGGRDSTIPGRFCCASCMRSYHG